MVCISLTILMHISLSMKQRRPLQAFLLLASVLSLTACGSLVPFAKGGTPSKRSSAEAGVQSGGQSRVASAPRNYSNRPEDRSCIAGLQAAGAEFVPLPDSYAGPGCSKLGTVQLSAIPGDASQFSISNIGAVQCNTATKFSNWARFGVDRAARQILGSSLKRIETMGSYACRNIAGSSRRSAHATAGAIDVSAFILEDGRRVSLKDDWHGGTRAEREFLRVVHRSACKRFGTVLGPDYNRAHEDHFHLESGERSFCR